MFLIMKTYDSTLYYALCRLYCTGNPRGRWSQSLFWENRIRGEITLRFHEPTDINTPEKTRDTKSSGNLEVISRPPT